MTRSSQSDIRSRPTRSNRALELLEEEAGEVTIGELAEAVFRADDGAGSLEAVHQDLFERVLPSLEERGELRFDVDRGVVTVGSNGRVTVLDRLQERLWR